jgi:CBS domain-containing protein
MPIAMKVRDLLVPLSEYAVTTAGESLAKAVPVLKRLYCKTEDGKCTAAGHRNILVLDDSGKLVGIMSFRSILKALIPEFAGGTTARLESLEVSIAFAQAGAPHLDEAQMSFRARVLKNAETKVQDVMLKIRGTIDADSDLLEAVKMICSNKITVIPVYEKGKLLGVLRDSDLFLVVADILKE